MIPHQKISRWLTTSVDPIAIEDWVANREIFGETKDRELEDAFAIENGLEVDDLLLLKVEGKTVEIFMEKQKKKIIKAGEFFVSVPPEGEIKLKVRGKKEISWQGSGKKIIIVEAV